MVNMLITTRNFFLITIYMVYKRCRPGESETLSFKEVFINNDRRIVLIGFLDALVMLLTVFSNTYLPGNLVILLTQFVIPVSLVLDRFQKLQRGHDNRKYIGAITIVFGAIVSLGFLSESSEECLTSSKFSTDDYCQFCDRYDDRESCEGDDTLDENGSHICEYKHDSETSDRQLSWAFALLLCAVPVYFSTLEKGKILTDENSTYRTVDHGFIYALTSKWQLVFACLLTPIFGLLQDPTVAIDDLPDDLSDGFDCFGGTGTIEDTCFPDDDCSDYSQTYVNIFLISNIFYNYLLYIVVEVPSTTDLLWFSMSIMIPICSIVYMIPGFPDEQSASYDKFLSVILIAGGTIVYRKGNTWEKLFKGEYDRTEPLLSVSHHDNNESAEISETSTKRECLVMF